MIRTDAGPAGQADDSSTGAVDPLDRRDYHDRLSALEALMDGVAIFDEQVALRYANPAFCEMFECADAETLVDLISSGAGWSALFHSDEIHRVKDDILPLVFRSGSWRGRLRAVRSSGTPFMAEASFARVTEDGFVVVMRDVTAQAEAHEALEERQRMYSLLAHNSTDVISLHDVDGRISYISPASLRLMGCEKQSLLGKLPWESIHPDDQERAFDAFQQALDGGSGSVSYRIKVKSGVWIWFETLVRPVHLDETESVDRIQCSTRDITAQKKLEEQLEHQALHDPLTGLPNRSLFMDRLSQAPMRARRSGNTYGVVYLDLNRFKQVNDTLGHSAGDDLLVQVADRLTAQMRETDTLARLSGDEFAIVLEGIEDEGIIEQLGPRLLSIFDEPFVLGESTATVRPSIGIAFDEDGNSEPEGLLRSADLAMYAAKRDPDHEWIARIGDGNGSSLELQAALREAIEHDTLELHYQPLVAIDDGRPVALEALLRWEHPELGQVAPPEILAIAQQGNFGPDLTRWVVRTALAQSRPWVQRGFKDLRLCLNLSDDELTAPGLGDIIAHAVREAGAHASALQLEFGSRVLRRHADKLAALRAAGAIIAIDGFGIDPVSLPLLARAPIDALKIARPLIDSLGEGDGDAAAEAILGMGGRLGLQVSAEGIENEAQVVRLREMGCETIQGFYVGRPLPAHEVEGYLLSQPTS